MPVPAHKPRRRGRPPTIGEYVGLHQAKAELLAQKRVEMRLRAEEELGAEVAQFRKARRAPVKVSGPVVELSSKTAAELQIKIQIDDALIGTIASKSSNIKSDLVRDLRAAASSVTEASAKIVSRTADDKSRRLRSQNATLQTELASIRKELESFKAEMGRMSARGRAPSPVEEADGCPTPARSAPKKRRIEPETALSLEDVCRKVTATVGVMVNARLAALEDRLLPEKSCRLPLAGDKRAQAGFERQQQQPQTQRQPQNQRQQSRPRHQPGLGKRRRKRER